jgi:hypothetical protein
MLKRTWCSGLPPGRVGGRNSLTLGRLGGNRDLYSYAGRDDVKQAGTQNPAPSFPLTPDLGYVKNITSATGVQKNDWE